MSKKNGIGGPMDVPVVPGTRCTAAQCGRTHRQMVWDEHGHRRSKGGRRGIATSLGATIRAQEEERRRIARDLHDSTAQHLVLLAAALKRLQNSASARGPKFRPVFSEAQELAALALREVRTLSYLLYPPMLDESGLEDAISHYVEGYGERTGVQVNVQVSPRLGRLGETRRWYCFAWCKRA